MTISRTIIYTKYLNGIPERIKIVFSLIYREIDVLTTIKISLVIDYRYFF